MVSLIFIVGQISLKAYFESFHMIELDWIKFIYCIKALNLSINSLSLKYTTVTLERILQIKTLTIMYFRLL